MTQIVTVAALALMLNKPSVEIKMEAGVKVERTVPAQFLPENANCHELSKTSALGKRVVKENAVKQVVRGCRI